MQGHKPEFMYNMILNFSIVFAETIGYRLMLKTSYLTKMLSSLIPQILIIAVFPVILKFTPVEIGWSLSVIGMLIIGTFKFSNRIIGWGIGIFNTTFFGIAGQFPPHYISALVIGQALSFLSISILRMVCLLVFPGDNETAYFNSTLMYFGLNVLILLFTVISMPVNYSLDLLFIQYFFKSNFFNYYITQQKKQQMSVTNSVEEQLSTEGQ